MKLSAEPFTTAFPTVDLSLVDHHCTHAHNNKFNLQTGWAELKQPHPGDRHVVKFPREGMGFVIKPPP